MPSRLRPTNPTAADAILVGDPGRALLLAQELLVNPLMSNHARGLWGYTALTPEGMPLTIQATGMGGPSAAIVISDLVRLGLRRAVRVGTCESLDPALANGTLTLAETATLSDGTSQALANGAGDGVVEPAAAINGQLASAGLPGVTVRSGDFGSAVRWAVEAAPPTPVPGGNTVFDLQTATLFALAARLGIQVGALLVVEGPVQTRRPDAPDRLAAEELEEPIRRAGRIAAETLLKAQPQP